jgi:hypothetical protein
MKVLILTRQLRDFPEEKKLIDQSSIIKISVNHTPCKSDYRVFSDYDKWHEYQCENYIKRKEKLITQYAGILVLPRYIWMYYKPVNYPSLHNDKNDIIKDHKKGNFEELFYYGGSIIPSIDLGIRLGATKLLIIGDNKVYYEKFQRHIRESIEKLKVYCDMYCWRQDNNFNLPYENLAKFLQGE